MDSLLAVIIINNNRCQDTLDCLRSVASTTYAPILTIVLDIASSDASVEAIVREFPQIEVVKLVENRGYAGNNNVGIRLAMRRGAKWIFVLNEDTILAPDCIQRIFEESERDPQIGILGPMVYHFDDPMVIQSAGVLLDSFWRPVHPSHDELDTNQFPAARPVDWISGCALMIRAAVIEQIGPFDERYFMYWEETDYCLEAARRGWRIVHVPGAKLWHKGYHRHYQPVPYVIYYMTRNRFIFLVKHQAGFLPLAIAMFETLRTLLAWSIKPRWRHMREHRDAVWRGLADFLSSKCGPMPK